jgi:isochorismate hydrolase
LSYLRDKKIGTLIIAGANGGACVLSSIQGILNENVNVLAYSQAIADFNFHSFAYPYEYKNQRLTYHCPTCRFRETNSINDVFPLLRIVHPNQVDRLISEMSSPRGDCKK